MARVRMHRLQDTVCGCYHWYEDHDPETGGCRSRKCDCDQFSFDAELNTRRAIADREGEHDQDCCCALCFTAIDAMAEAVR